MKNSTLLDDWARECAAYFAGNLVNVHPIHPCVINGRPHYVHEPQLATRNPEYYARLLAFANEHGIGLKADQRRPSTNHHPCARKKFFPIMFLAIGFLSAVVHAEEFNQQLGLMAVTADSNYFESTTNAANTGWIGELEHTLVSKTLEQILLSHLEQTERMPASMQRDIEELSIYYARYPAVVKLLGSIANANWKLRYAPHTFQTTVSGSRLHVDNIEVFFDPRSAARLKFYDKCRTQKPFCVASPADALLHEFLHVQSITQNTADFIRQGGLDPMRYPAEHERLTIHKENQLYQAMTEVDGHARPIRSEHNGRHVLVSCATCLE